ncbi:MAG: DUF4412 domain-containing protein [Bacteroidales bacterium]|nr:DUF4412 domain-containing protein [Bacteroidales bacterium]
MKKYSLLIILFFVGFQSFGQKKHQPKFEGKIKFARITQTDTTYFSYLVKGDKVKFISYDPCIESEQMQEYLLFDLAKKKIIAVKPSFRTYIVLQNKLFTTLPDEEFKIIPSRNHKKILGQKCYQWRVKNKKENTEIAFWVNKKYNYDFFIPLLKLWNRVEKHASYFLQIPNNNGVFPFLSTERSVVRDFRMQLSVVEIIYEPLNDSLFIIPAEYTNYDH